MQKYFHINFPDSANRFQILQEYMVRPYLMLTAIFGIVILVLISQHKPVLWTGIIGSFAIVFLGNMLGQLYAKNAFLEMGFSEEYYYMRSAYDIAYKKDLRLYPIVYANATRQGDTIMVNYIEQNVKIRHAEWKEWEEVWHRLHYHSMPEV
ncbi:MAG: hypothetical protein ACXWEY_09765 [Bacteroidia bacterium]